MPSRSVLDVGAYGAFYIAGVPALLAIVMLSVIASRCYCCDTCRLSSYRVSSDECVIDVPRKYIV